MLESSQGRSGSFKHLPTIEEDQPVFQKDSLITGPLLSNYILAINLMTNIAARFAGDSIQDDAEAAEFDAKFEERLQSLKHI